MSQVAKDFLAAAAVVQSWYFDKKGERPESFLSHGLCSVIVHAMYRNDTYLKSWWRVHDVERWLVESYQQWPEGSGHRVYPIKAPWYFFWMSPARAYGYYRAKSAMWKGAYGQKRIALLNWLIEKAKKEIEESKGE